MSDKRRDGEIDAEAPPSPEEEAASTRLREALEGVGDPDPIAAALKAAWAPEALEPEEHAAIVDEVPTTEELALAEELREALEGTPPSFVTLLQSTWEPHAIDAKEHRAIVERAIDAPVVVLRPQRFRVIVGGATAVLAIAAGLIVWVTTAPATAAPLARSRSTQPLFDEPFTSGQASARIDKIVLARAADYRDNRFAKWGVR